MSSKQKQTEKEVKLVMLLKLAPKKTEQKETSVATKSQREALTLSRLMKLSKNTGK